MNALLCRITALLLVLLAGNRAHAQFAVAIAVDAPAELRWAAQEMPQWERLHSEINAHLRRTDELIRLTGDPERTNDRIVAAPSSVLQPASEALALDTRQATLASARQRFHLSSVAAPTYNEENKVAANYSAFGETRQREPRRYTHFGQQEALYARHKQAAENAEKLERHELEVQRKALEALRRAGTHAEIALIEGVLAASQQRVGMGQAKLAQAAAELEAFRGQLAFEDERKAEADREWTETVIERMREKALAGYRAQMGGSP